MIKNIFAAGVFAAASLAVVSVANAGDIPATPMNHGPMVMHGMGLVGDVANVGMTPVNMVAQPILAPGMARGEPMAEPAMTKRHHHHRMMKKYMMKKHM